MMMKITNACFLILGATLGLLLTEVARAQQYGEVDEEQYALSFRVEPADDWTGIFARDTGWFGGDGFFAIPRNGVDTIGGWVSTASLLVFSDSFWGDKTGGVLTPGAKMTNNVVADFAGGDTQEPVRFHSTYDTDGARASVFVPSTPMAEEGQYYWLGDGFVNPEQGYTTYVFAYRMENTGEEVFGFRERGNVLIAIDAQDEPPFSRHRQYDTPLHVETDLSSHGAGYSFGAGILANTTWAGAPNPDGFVYVYGVRGAAKELLVARARPASFDDFATWRYWDGQAWQADIGRAAAITTQVSNELSVTPLPDGRYVLVFQHNGIDPWVGLRVGLSPVGPFGPVVGVYECPEPLAQESLYAYNAKAHPHLSDKGELLISYHVNSFDFLNDLNRFPSVFSPRFIRLVFD